MHTEDGKRTKGEVIEISDADGLSATDEPRELDDKPKRKRRRREIDMIRLDDDDDEEEWEGDSPSRSRKLSSLGSPGPQSPGHAGAREPRSCVLKASQKRKPLSRLLEQLLRNLEKRDPNQFFAWPVNDNFAPGYSSIIRRPMDFSTIKQKIDDNEYRSLNCFVNDFKLMCNNAMKYNKSGTVYHKAARRLLHAGLKQLTPAKLRPLGHMLTYMYEIPIRELGFDIGKMDAKVLKGSQSGKSGGEEGDPPSDSASESKQERSGSEDDVKIKMEAAREQHRKRLARKAFPRMDADGKTTLCLVVEGGAAAAAVSVGADAAERPRARPLTLGNYVGKLQHGSGVLQSFREDRRNLVKGVKPLSYGPFSSYAPSYDSTFATLTKDESHLLYHTYNCENGRGNEDLLRFAPDSPWALIYDMEEMFPDKKKETTPITPPEEETRAAAATATEVKVELAALRSLAELGIDVDFLQDMEEEVAASQHDYGLSASLQHTLKLLHKLHKEQSDRLSAPLPTHLSLVARPSASERELARCAASCLRGMAARVAPQHVAPLAAVRKAMGVTLDHLDTPMSLDDFIELEMSGTDMRPDDLK